MESKEIILEKLRLCSDKEKYNTARNSMGVSESFYNKYYLVFDCFEYKDLEKMSKEGLNNLIKLADHASDVFY